MEWIDEIVTGLLDLYGTRDVYEICDVLKINIEKHPADHRLLRGNKGNYMRCISDIEMIVLREDLDEACEEFVLAHELGHALLHTNLNSFVFRALPIKVSMRNKPIILL